jgi:hypothetical protein
MHEDAEAGAILAAAVQDAGGQLVPLGQRDRDAYRVADAHAHAHAIVKPERDPEPRRYHVGEWDG